MVLNEEGERWRHLKYVSFRLAGQLLDLLRDTESNGRLSKVGIELKPSEFVSVAVERGAKAKEFGGTAVAVARALEVGFRGTYVDLSGHSDAQAITKNQLVKATLLFQPAHLQIQNYDLVHPMRDPYYVVGWSSIDRVPGIGRVFVGLVGSEHNLLSLPGDGTKGAGHTASDAEGLYEMIQHTKEEAYGEDIKEWRLKNDLPSHYRDATDAERLKAVASAFAGYDVQSAPRPTEAFFQVHYVARNVELDALAPHTDGAGKVDLAIFGAPIWVREATDRELLSVADILNGTGSVDEKWEVLDEELRRHLRDERYTSEWTPQSDDEWRHLGRWAVAWATRVGPETTRLLWLPRRRYFFGIFQGSQVDEAVQSQIEGWLAHDWDTDGYVLSEAGEVYPVYLKMSARLGSTAPTRDRNDEVIYQPNTDLLPMAWDDEDAGEAASMILLSVSRWLLPVADRRRATRRSRR